MLVAKDWAKTGKRALPKNLQTTVLSAALGRSARKDRRTTPSRVLAGRASLRHGASPTSCREACASASSCSDPTPPPPTQSAPLRGPLPPSWTPLLRIPHSFILEGQISTQNSCPNPRLNSPKGSCPRIGRK
eukprot:12256092-Alexandrium_andersonii.AAC.1